jgi:hypothetical protein
MKKIMPRRAALGALALFTLAVGDVATASAQILIDDFTTGPVTLQVPVTGFLENRTQPGAAIAGGVRCTMFDVTGNPYQRAATLDIRDGRLVVDTGVLTDHAIWLLYGWDENCEPAGLDLDLSAYVESGAFRFDFAGLDRGTAGAIVVWGNNGTSAIPFGVDTVANDFAYARLSDFVGDDVWSHVQHIGIVIQTGGVAPGHDYAIRSIWAVPGY